MITCHFHFSLYANLPGTLDPRHTAAPMPDHRFARCLTRAALAVAVPVAVIGSEEQAPALFNAKRIGKMLGAPAFPITPTWPLLGPMGAVPYPSKYRIHFGPPMHFRYNEDEDPATDLANKSKLVKNTLQAMLDRGVRERKHIFW